MIPVHVAGAFWNRQPLAYPAIAARLAGRIETVAEPRDARLIIVAHPLDLRREGRRLAALCARRPRLRVVLLSEEPFWDSCWAADPFAPFQAHPVGRGVVLPVAVLNHATAPLFSPGRLPYFLLTDPRYGAAYRGRFARNAGRSVADWLRHFREAPLEAAFVAEKRTLPRHAPAFPAHGVWGLSLFRTRLARHCRGTRLLRLGRGWAEGPPRQELPDWHAEKLARLDLACRYVSAVENTHQAPYVSEKIYDAFAVGAVPLYVAGPGHAVGRLVGEGGWINLFDRLDRSGSGPPGFGPTRPFDAGAPVAGALAEAFAATQARLARLFDTEAVAEAERDRLADAIAAALARLVA